MINTNYKELLPVTTFYLKYFLIQRFAFPETMATIKTDMFWKNWTSLAVHLGAKKIDSIYKKETKQGHSGSFGETYRLSFLFHVCSSHVTTRLGL